MLYMNRLVFILSR